MFRGVQAGVLPDEPRLDEPGTAGLVGEIAPAELAEALRDSPHAERIGAILAEAHEVFAAEQRKPQHEE